MGYSKILRGLAVSFACLGFLLPQSLLGAGVHQRGHSSVRGSVVRDVALQDGGLLTGQTVNQKGLPMANILVSVGRKGHEIARVVTDADGRYSIKGLRGGAYEIKTANSGGLYRLWASNTAPPSAQQGALLVVNTRTVRGQFGGGGFGFLSNPWVLAGIVAAAIAIPLSLDDDKSAS